MSLQRAKLLKRLGKTVSSHPTLTSELALLFSKVNSKKKVSNYYQVIWARDSWAAIDAPVKLNKDFIIPHTQKAFGTEKAVFGYSAKNFFPWFLPLKYSFQSKHHDKGSI